MRNITFLLVSLVLIGLFSLGFKKPRDNSLEIQVDLGQILVIGFEGQKITPELSFLVKKIKPGGILLLKRNIESKTQLVKLIEDLQKISRENSGLPLFVAVDQEGGLVSRVPWAENTPQSSLQNIDQAFEVGSNRAKDLREAGINVNLAPVLDSNNPNDYLYSRSFKKDKNLAFQLGRELIKGHLKEGVISIPKHFPGYDGVTSNPEIEKVPEVELVPDISLFQRLFQELELPLVMLSNVVYKDLDSQNPFPFSPKGIQMLRYALGESVIILSDDLLSKAILAQYNFSEIGRKAIKAGVDMLLLAGYPDANLVEEFYDEFLGVVLKDRELQKIIEQKASKIREFKLSLKSR